MPALVAGIHVLQPSQIKGVDGRDEPGHDDAESRSICRLVLFDHLVETRDQRDRDYDAERLAVLRLTTRSYLFDACTGTSPVSRFENAVRSRCATVPICPS
jgi:hypothetical protein